MKRTGEGEESGPLTISAEDIHAYFQKAGKQLDLEELKEMMTECGQETSIPEFEGSAKVTVDVFKKVMTSFLVEPTIADLPQGDGDDSSRYSG